MRVWSLGEVLWDVFGEGREVFGGAPLNVCAHLVRLGHGTRLLSAVGDDARGRRALERMRALGLETDGVQQVMGLPTGTAVVTLNERGEATFGIERPAAYDGWVAGDALLTEAAEHGPDWLYLGTLMQTAPGMEEQTTRLVAAMGRRTRVFYDMNLREGHWNAELVARLTAMTDVLKLNEHEAAELWRLHGNGVFALERFCAEWAGRYGLEAVAVTLGGEGCFVWSGGQGLRVPGFTVKVEDTVGSGDAFAAAFLHGYAAGWERERIARFANALGALVASRAGATPEWAVAEVERMVERG
jgi:fructokinase